MRTPLRSIGLVATVLLIGGLAAAMDEQILGKKLIVKDRTLLEDNRVVIGLGKETATSVGALSSPLASGATLQIIANGTTPYTQTFTLSSVGWSATSTGYKYSGPTAGEPVKRVILKRTPSGVALLKAIVKGNVGTDPLTVRPPNSASNGGLILDVIGGNRYCVAFGTGTNSTTLEDSDRQWKVINATLEAGCPVPATTTTSSTTSTTLPCDCCGNLPSLLRVTSTGGGASTGSVTPATCEDGSSCPCGSGQTCLGPLAPNLVYFGGGNSAAPSSDAYTRAVPPNGDFYLRVASCTGGGDPLLTSASATDVVGAGSPCAPAPGTPSAENRRCTDVGCLLGPPIDFAVLTELGLQSLCGINKISTSTTGSIACTTGAMTATLTFVKDTWGGVCPKCVGGTVGVCASGTCDSGPQNGMSCTPESPGLTSHDCPPTGSPSIANFGPFTVGGTTGTSSKAAFDPGSGESIFCGYCFDGGNYTTPCTTDAACAPNVCSSHSDGAFGHLSATNISMTGSSPGTCIETGVHPITLVEVGCQESAVQNSYFALPGPTASSLRGTVELLP